MCLACKRIFALFVLFRGKTSKQIEIFCIRIDLWKQWPGTDFVVIVALNFITISETMAEISHLTIF